MAVYLSKTKVLKRIIKIGYVIVAVFVSLIFLIYLLFSTYSFQNYLAGRVIEFVKKKFHVTIMLKEISYDGWSYFSLRNAGIATHNNDTLFYAGRVQFDITGINIDSIKFTLSNVTVDEGLCKIVTYKDGSSSLDVLDYFTDSTDTTVSDGPPFQLILKNVEAMDSRFYLIDSTSVFANEGFDALNMHVTNVNVKSKNFVIVEDSLNFDIRHLRGYEKSGIVIKSINGHAIICSHLMEFSNLDAYINNSHVKNYFSMQYNSWDDFSNFEDNVIMRANIVNAKADIQDVALFAPVLKNYHYTALVNGKLSGPLSRMRFRDLEAFTGKHTIFKGMANITGLPNIDETLIEVNADYAQTVKSELEQVAGIELPELLELFGLVSFKGKYTGFINDFVSYGTFESAYGKVFTDLNMKLADEVMNSEYSGHVAFTNFNLGSFLQQNSLGFITGKAKAVGKGFDLDKLKGDFLAEIKSVDFNGHTYENISFDLAAFKKSLTGEFSIDDEDFLVFGKGTADLGGKYIKLNAGIDVEKANLKQLNLLPYDIKLSTHINANFNFAGLSDNYGTIDVTNTIYDKDGFMHRLQNISLKSNGEGEQKSISINSDFLNFSVNGSFAFEGLFDQVRNYTAEVVPNYFMPVPIKQNFKQDFNFKLRLKNTTHIAPLFYPDIDIVNLRVEGNVNSALNEWGIMLVADKFKFKEKQLVLPKLKIEISDGKMSSLGSLESLKQNDTLQLGDAVFKIEGQSGKLTSILKLADSAGWFTTQLNNVFYFYYDSIIADFTGAGFVGLKQLKLNIDTGTQIILAHNQVYVKNGHLFNSDNNVYVNGYHHLDKSMQSTNIKADLQRLSLAVINAFIPETNIKFGGLATGGVQLKNIGGRYALISNIQLTDFSLDNDIIGSYLIKSDFTENERGVLVDIKSTAGKIQNLTANGTIDFTGNKLDVEVSFARSDANTFQAFLKEYVTLFSGQVSMLLNVKGKIDDPEVYGNLNLSNIKARVEYLKTTYTLSSSINFNKDIIVIEPFRMFDVNRNAATVSGTINHKNFTDFIYNINVEKFTNLEVLNTKAKDNSLFYGNAFASGSASIKGSGNKVLMDITATTNKGTNIIINPFAYTEAEATSIVTFINHADTLPGEIAASKAVPTGFGIKLNLRVTPDAEVKMIFDANAEDNIKAVGQGNLNLELTSTGDFLMYGNYTLTSGNYHLTAANVVSKRFSLKQGGTIVWNGDPMGGRLDISGLYRLRTTINEIVRLPEGTNAQNRIPVECVINIKGTVEKPVIGFDLNFPELDNYVTGAASNELNAVIANFRREPDLMNQQILFLLISGKFIPLNNNNVANQGVNIGSQTVSDLFTSSASGLLNKFIPDFDVSIDMLNATDPTRGRAYLLSASKRFLDNRLEVQGSYATDNSQNNFTANYNIIKSGRLKGRVFNRSGLDPIYNRNITTSGIGLYYRKEFDSFLEIFKKQNQYNF
jgi:hypothetical protein